MGEEADWRGLEEEEGTLSPPAAEDDQREMWERHSELSEAMGEDAEAERGCPDGASPGPEQDKRLPEGDRLLGNEPGAGNEPGPEPAPDSQPEDGAQVCLKAGAAVTVVFSAKEEARSLQTLVGVVRCGQALRQGVRHTGCESYGDAPADDADGWRYLQGGGRCTLSCGYGARPSAEPKGRREARADGHE